MSERDYGKMWDEIFQRVSDAIASKTNEHDIILIVLGILRSNEHLMSDRTTVSIGELREPGEAMRHVVRINGLLLPSGASCVELRLRS
jgi:hypothetical protein